MDNPITGFVTYLKYQRGFSPATVIAYESDVVDFSEFLLNEGVGVNEVNQEVIRQYLTTQLEKKISKRTLRRRIAALRHYYKWRGNNKLTEKNAISVLWRNRK